MKVADKVLGDPRVYRVAAETGDAALKVLPHFAIYNRLNAWGRRRDIPGPAPETFHHWYAHNRATEAKPPKASATQSETSSGAAG